VRAGKIKLSSIGPGKIGDALYAGDDGKPVEATTDLLRLVKILEKESQ